MSSTVLLLFLVILIWGFPFIFSVLVNRVNILHPTTFFPLLVIMSTISSVSEKIYGWSEKFEHKGLRFKTSEYLLESYNYPLFLLALSGLFYMLGIFLYRKKILPERIILYNFNPNKNKLIFFKTIFLLIFLTAPILFFGIDSGFFFTTAFYTSVFYFPIILFTRGVKSGITLGIFIFILFLLFTTISPSFSSKTYVIVFFTSIVMFFLMKNQNIFKYFSLRMVMLYIVIIFSLNYTISSIQTMRGDEYSSPIYQLFYREYGFDMFTILVNENDFVHKNINWGALEFNELIPGKIASLLGFSKGNAGLTVVEYFLEDEFCDETLGDCSSKVANLGNNRITSVYRHFLFFPFFDYGLKGIIFASFIIGYINSICYSWGVKKYYQFKDPIYLISIFPIIINMHYILNGAYAIAIMHMVITHFIIRYFFLYSGDKNVMKKKLSSEK